MYQFKSTFDRKRSELIGSFNTHDETPRAAD